MTSALRGATHGVLVAAIALATGGLVGIGIEWSRGPVEVSVETNTAIDCRDASKTTLSTVVNDEKQVTLCKTVCTLVKGSDD